MVIDDRLVTPQNASKQIPTMMVLMVVIVVMIAAYVTAQEGAEVGVEYDWMWWQLPPSIPAGEALL